MDIKHMTNKTDMKQYVNFKMDMKNMTTLKWT